MQESLAGITHMSQVLMGAPFRPATRLSSPLRARRLAALRLIMDATVEAAATVIIMDAAVAAAAVPMPLPLPS